MMKRTSFAAALACHNQGRQLVYGTLIAVVLLSGCSSEQSSIPTEQPAAQGAAARATSTAVAVTPSALPTAVATNAPPTATASPTATARLPSASMTATPSVLPTAAAATAALPSASASARPPAVEQEARPGAQKRPAAELAARDRAIADLAQRLGIDTAQIEVLGISQQYQRSATSDSPGTPVGWRIRLAVGDTVYQYQSDQRGSVKQLPANR